MSGYCCVQTAWISHKWSVSIQIYPYHSLHTSIMIQVPLHFCLLLLVLELDQSGWIMFEQRLGWLIALPILLEVTIVYTMRMLV